MHEFEWIKDYFQPLTNDQPEAGQLQNDAAVFAVEAGYELVVTTDTINEDIHFIRNTEPSLIARKSLAVNLSDLAAMGAKPYGYTLALSLPKQTYADWVASFCEGLHAMQTNYDCFLLGGDTTGTRGTISITVTAFGLVEKGKALGRDKAQAGDIIYVTGEIGDAYLGLHALKHSEDENILIQRYLLPSPRIAAGQQLVGYASTCMDISDGLPQDLGHICAASGMGATIHIDRVPISDVAREYADKHNLTLPQLIAGGDDYELLFTLPKKHEVMLKQLHVPVTAIGEITQAHEGVQILKDDGQPVELDQKGYQHF